MDTHVLPNPQAVADFAADLISSELQRPRSNLGLAGGSTPKATYNALATKEVDWARIPVWLADERWVPSTDDQSNRRMALEAFSGAIDTSLIPVPWHLGIDAIIGAALYEDALKAHLPTTNGHITPDLVVLGIGDDGHTASLFPGTDALTASGEYVANWVPKLDTWRVTATVSMLQSARKLLFLVTGEGKAQTMAQIMTPSSNHPAAVVARGAQSALWVLDAQAGSLLEAQ